MAYAAFAAQELLAKGSAVDAAEPAAAEYHKFCISHRPRLITKAPTELSHSNEGFSIKG